MPEPINDTADKVNASMTLDAGTQTIVDEPRLQTPPKSNDYEEKLSYVVLRGHGTNTHVGTPKKMMRFDGSTKRNSVDNADGILVKDSSLDRLENEARSV